MATLRIDVARVEHHAGERGRTLVTAVLAIGASDTIRAGRLWLDANMSQHRAEGFKGLLYEWGVPRRAVVLVED